MKGQRWIAVILALFGFMNLINGIAMFFFPHAWFFTLVPGVPETGPFNAHLVADGGTFSLALAVGLAFAAYDPRRNAVAVVIAAVAGVMHSALHIYSHEAGLLSLSHLSTEIYGIFVPTIILCVLAAMLMRPADMAAHRVQRAA
jgi:predicted anti-sigma-YlaC factor YlaD